MAEPNSPERIVIRHLSGAKVNQVEEFSLEHVTTILIGRTNAADLQFDPEHDDLVSREHARITRAEDDPTRFSLTDLGSRNGTFLNKVQVAGSATLRPGDVIQLGEGGPRFAFDLEPHPVAETRIALPATDLRATAIAPVHGDVPMRTTDASVDRPPANAVVGRETVERMMDDVQRKSSKKMGGAMFAVGGLALLLMVAGIYYVNSTAAEQRAEQARQLAAVTAGDGTMTPAEINTAHGDAVVFIQASWRLIDTREQNLVYHQHEQQQINGQIMTLGRFLQLPDGRIEPLLATSNPLGINKPIASMAFGSGFVVSQDGFILTNRHVVRGWHYPYQFPPGMGVLYRLDASGQLVVQTNERGQPVRTPQGAPIPLTELIDPAQIYNWIPAESAFYNEQFVVENLRPLAGEGSISVTFQNSDNPTDGRFVRDSPRADAALIKIDPPDVLHATPLNDTYETSEVGDPVVIMGYPSVSGFDLGTSENVEMGAARRTVVSFVPRVTVTPANISSIHRSRRSDRNPDERVVALGFPDAYQLSTSETGSGNSGGPVFNDRGEVIAIFTYGSSSGGASVTYAIPIRYGMELRRTTGVR